LIKIKEPAINQEGFAKGAGSFDEMFWQERDNCDTFSQDRNPPPNTAANKAGAVCPLIFTSRCTIDFAQRRNTPIVRRSLGVVVQQRVSNSSV
jgi:hypothetical protein